MDIKDGRWRTWVQVKKAKDGRKIIGSIIYRFSLKENLNSLK